jgi:hypothetical protein
VVRQPSDLLKAVRARREELGLTHLEMDHRIGLASGHYGKLESAGAAWGRVGFRLTASMANALDALGLELVLVEQGAPRGRKRA